MARLGVGSVFTNVTLLETIHIGINILFKVKTCIAALIKEQFHELPPATMSESLVLFDREYYQHVDGIAMGSPLGPTLANAFLCYHGQIWLENCRLEFKPAVYRRYIDDTFSPFRSREHTKSF